MNNDIKNISSRFTRNILIIQSIAFLVLIGVMLSSNYLLKMKLADQVARTVESKYKGGDTREVINILSDARNNDFLAVELFDRNNQSQLIFPTQYHRKTSSIESIWRSLAHIKYEKNIYYDQKMKKSAGSIVFTFGFFYLLPLAVTIFFLGMIATYPLIRKYRGLLFDSFEKETVKNQKEAITELARQVRHDYKSPLTAIKSVIDKAESLKETERKTLSVAYNKMLSMLNDLSQENIQQVLKGNTKKTNKKSLTHVYSSVLNVIQEKQARLGYDSSIKIDFKCSSDDKRAYILLDDVELQRVISNIIENSIDAIEESGHIEVTVTTNNTNLIIVISDNGKGMPQEILSKIGQKGFSFDKKSGEGLGLYSSFKKIENWSGQLNIISNEDTGTKVTIELPKAVKPKWASSEINFDGMENIVILDDDESIHNMWKQKLRNANQAKVFHFKNAQTLLKRLNKFSERTLFLLDYELRGQKETGLDIVRSIDNKSMCYLVSNSFQDPSLQRECKNQNLKLIPKQCCYII